MPLELEDIASALQLDVETDKEVVESMKGRIEAWLKEMDLDDAAKANAEKFVELEMRKWVAEAQVAEIDMPTGIEDWYKGLDQRLSVAGKNVVGRGELMERNKEDTIEAHGAQKVRHKNEAERMDEGAEEMGLPKVEAFSDDHAPKIAGGAGMDKVAVARLGENEALATGALASCTGVTLFDPETKVGAVLHIYQGKVTIQDALAEMQKVDPNVAPERLQATLMPGVAEGVNMSHLESLRLQLSEAGITKVRDFSKEGRTAGDILLTGDGSVIADIEPQKWVAKTDAPEVVRKASVAEALGMERQSKAHKSGELGTDIDTTETRMKQAGAKSNSRGQKPQ
jgi:hypothetical protein